MAPHPAPSPDAAPAPPAGPGAPLPRVGIDARMWRHTGIGRYLSNLVPRLTPRVAPVAWVAPADLDDARAAWPGVEVRACGAPLFSIREQLAWPALIREAGVALFHAPHLNAPLACPVPLVVTIHDLIPFHFPGTHNARAGAAYFHAMARLVTRRAARVLTDAEVTRQDLVRLVGVDPGKLTVAPLAADPNFGVDQGADRRRHVRARFGLDGPFVLYAGQWKRYKNLETLIAAFAGLVAGGRRPGLRLVLAGREDPNAPHVQAAIAAHGLADRVVTTGWIADDADLVALYQAASAFAFPSRYEGFGLPPLEAMAAGVPVVTSDAGALAEAVGAGGLIVRPDDTRAWTEALARVLDDPDLRARLVAAGHARVAALSWEATANQTLATYAAVLGARA